MEKGEWRKDVAKELNHIETLQVKYPDSVTLRRIARQIAVCLQLEESFSEPEWKDFKNIG